MRGTGTTSQLSTDVEHGKYIQGFKELRRSALVAEWLHRMSNNHNVLGLIPALGLLFDVIPPSVSSLYAVICLVQAKKTKKNTITLKKELIHVIIAIFLNEKHIRYRIHR